MRVFAPRARRVLRGNEVDARDGAGSIQGIVEEGIAKWRAAKHQANPFGHITSADESDMRRRITEYERARRGLPLNAGRALQETIEWNLFTYLDAQQSQVTEPPWKVRGLVVEGGATQVSAHPHGMKSLSWLNAVLEAVTSHKVWRHFDASKVERALFIESEDPRWLVEARIKGIAQGLGLANNEQVPGFVCACPGPFDLVKEEQSLRELFSKHRPDFVVLSTLQNVLGGRDWASQKEMQDVNALIVRLSRVVPLVVLTHSPWNREQRRAAGTITQFANFAVTMHYEKVRPSRAHPAQDRKKRGEKGDHGRDERGACPVDPNDPRLTSELQDVNIEADAYADWRSRSEVIHVLMDSKVGTAGDFHLKLQTEGDTDDPSSVRGLMYGGEGRPKGGGKEAVLEALDNNPNASAEEIADCVGVSSRYVRKIKEAGKAKR
jgi:hypothetical protein